MSGQRRHSLTRLIPFLAALAILAGVAFKPAVLENLTPNNFGEVDAGKVYRSGQLTPAALDSLNQRYHFKTILDLGSFPEGSPGDIRNQRTADALHIPRYRFNLEGDATGNPNYYVQALSLMTDAARQPILVHCGAGSERTGCAVILYDNLVRGTPLDQGLTASQKFHHDDTRNPHLAEVLTRYSGPIFRAYRGHTQIEGVPPLPDPTPASLRPEGARLLPETKPVSPASGPAPG